MGFLFAGIRPTNKSTPKNSKQKPKKTWGGRRREEKKITIDKIDLSAAKPNQTRYVYGRRGLRDTNSSFFGGNENRAICMSIVCYQEKTTSDVFCAKSLFT